MGLYQTSVALYYYQIADGKMVRGLVTGHSLSIETTEYASYHSQPVTTRLHYVPIPTINSEAHDVTYPLIYTMYIKSCIDRSFCQYECNIGRMI